MKRLNWNEEFYLTFELNGKSFSTPSGRGFMAYFDASDEKKRLSSKGAKNIKIKVRTWN